MSNTVHLTEQGLKDLQAELDRLRTVDRPNVSQRIKEAKEGGDISESGEYEDAKQAQAFIEGRIKELERLLANAEVIDASAQKKGVIGLGSKVTVDDEGEHDTYMIVSSAESGGANLNGVRRISKESPVGQALLGHKKGDKVKVIAPNGSFTLKVLSVE